MRFRGPLSLSATINLLAEPRALTVVENAILEMAAWDKMGPEARRALAESQFGISASHIWHRYGGPYADDEAVAARVRAEDTRHCGQFNCKASGPI